MPVEVKKKLLELLNEGIKREIGVSIQYMWQHVMALGMESPEVREILQETAVTEMKHAETIAERLWYLGGTPTTQVTPIKVGGTIKEMIEDNIKLERDAITLYKSIIEECQKENDPVTRLMFEKILSDEEGHEDEFMTLLGLR